MITVEQFPDNNIKNLRELVAGVQFGMMSEHRSAAYSKVREQRSTAQRPKCAVQVASHTDALWAEVFRLWPTAMEYELPPAEFSET